MSTETWAASLSGEFREAAGKLASVIRENLPAGFEETADNALTTSPFNLSGNFAGECRRNNGYCCTKAGSVRETNKRKHGT